MRVWKHLSQQNDSTPAASETFDAFKENEPQLVSAVKTLYNQILYFTQNWGVNSEVKLFATTDKCLLKISAVYSLYLCLSINHLIHI